MKKETRKEKRRGIGKASKWNGRAYRKVPTIKK